MDLCAVDLALGAQFQGSFSSFFGGSCSLALDLQSAEERIEVASETLDRPKSRLQHEDNAADQGNNLSRQSINDYCLNCSKVEKSQAGLGIDLKGRNI